MNFLVALIAGLLFGGGLLLSGMTNPANVLAFLDVAGHWQPALAFTMAAAIAVAAPAFALARRRERSWLGEPVELPGRFRIDRRLVLGSAIFGLGWGLSGICPGPGLILLSRPNAHAVLFVAGMVVGMLAAGYPIRRGIQARISAKIQSSRKAAVQHGGPSEQPES